MTTTTMTFEDWAKGLLEGAAMSIAELARCEQRDPNYGDLVNTMGRLDEHSLSAVRKFIRGELAGWLHRHRPELLKGMKAAHASGQSSYGVRLGNTASNLFLMEQLGIPGEPPPDWTPPHFQHAYPLGDEDDEDTPWCQWRNLYAGEVSTAAQHLSGDGAGEFKDFALRIVPEMRDGETLLQVLARFGFGYPAQ